MGNENCETGRPGAIARFSSLRHGLSYQSRTVTTRGRKPPKSIPSPQFSRNIASPVPFRRMLRYTRTIPCKNLPDESRLQKMPPHHDPKPKVSAVPTVKSPSPHSAQPAPTGAAALLQRAEQAPQQLTPGQVMTLQRTVGNRVVGALIQRLGRKGKQAVAKMDQDEVTVAEVEQWQKKGGLTDADADAVVGLGEAKLVQALSMPPANFVGAATFAAGIDEMFEQAKTKKASKAMGEALSNAPKAAAKPAVLIALNDRGIADEDARPFIARAGAAAINPWLVLTADDTIVRRTIIASNKYAKTLAEMDALLVTANTHAYGVGPLLDLVIFHGYAAVLAALAATAAENRLTYLQLWLSYGVVAGSEVQLKRLVRFQARLRDGANPVFTVYQADRVYAGSLDPPSRTGFLRYNFGNEVMEVHTHWNEKTKRLVSMHVQDNSANGLEMNQWTWFADVATAVRDSHNGGAHAPTTDPVGGSLSL